MSAAAAAAKLLESYPTLCDPIDGSLPGSPVHGILQARTLEWVAISFSNAWKWKAKVKSLSRIRLFATPWTAAYQAPPSMGFSRQEYWSGLPLPSLSTLLHISFEQTILLVTISPVETLSMLDQFSRKWKSDQVKLNYIIRTLVISQGGSSEAKHWLVDSVAQRCHQW